MFTNARAKVKERFHGRVRLLISPALFAGLGLNHVFLP